MALMERLFAVADEPGERYTLEVRTSNTPALCLYERFGFREAGRRRGYYHDNREDAVIMWRTADRRGALRDDGEGTSARGATAGAPGRA